MDIIRRTRDGGYVLRDSSTGCPFYAPGPRNVTYNRMFAVVEWYTQLCKEAFRDINFAEVSLLADLCRFMPSQRYQVDTCVRLWVAKGSLYGVVITEREPSLISSILPEVLNG